MATEKIDFQILILNDEFEILKNNKNIVFAITGS